jgi:MarR family transcriptional regulator for hemolysin
MKKLSTSDARLALAFLLHDATRLIRRDFRRRVADLGLTTMQWRALAQIERNEGTSQTALADLLEVQPISLARVLDKLEAAGWVERRRDANDRRVLRIHLTTQAEPFLVAMHSHAAATMDRALAGVAPEERDGAIAVLTGIKRNLTDAV